MDEEKDVLKEYFHKTYLLNQNKVDRIIEEKAENYIDLYKYQSFFLNVNPKISLKTKKQKTKKNLVMPLIQWSHILIVKQMNQWKRISKRIRTSSDEEDDDNSDDDNESDKSSDEDLPDIEEDTSNSRKRKWEFSSLYETS